MSVDWRSIVERAQANGLRVVGFTDQHHFLTGIISQFGRGGSPEPPAGDWGQSPLPDSRKAKRELQTLLHPEMLGRAFQVLALAKNVDVRDDIRWRVLNSTIASSKGPEFAERNGGHQLSFPLKTRKRKKSDGNNMIAPATSA